MERGESGAGDPRMIQNEEHRVAGSYGDERARDASGWGGRRDWIRKEMSNEGIRKGQKPRVSRAVRGPQQPRICSPCVAKQALRSLKTSNDPRMTRRNFGRSAGYKHFPFIYQEIFIQFLFPADGN